MNPTVFSAILYDYADKNETKLLQIEEIAKKTGTPGVLFAMDETTVRQAVELLHEKNWVRYEGTHDLDQIRLKPTLSSIEFLTAYFEEREPGEASCQSPGGILE